MFEDIFPFAGHIRNEQISKGNTTFYPPGAIDKELTRVFAYIRDNRQLTTLTGDDFFDSLAYVMAELNIIHPFREGNGRSIREFIRLLAINNGVVLNWSNVDYQKILDASILSVDDYTALIDILKSAANE